MLYFIIINEEGRARVEELYYSGNTDALHGFLKRCGIQSSMFGIKEYAEAWTAFYNGEISREELRKKNSVK